MTGALALLAGVLLGLGAVDLPGPAWMVGGAMGAAGALLTPVRHSWLARPLALALGGLCLTFFSIDRWLALRVLPVGADSRVLLEGRVVSVPQRDGAELRFDADVLIVEGTGHDSRLRRARLLWRDAPYTPRVGERWRWVARLGEFSNTRNFAGADPARIAFRERVHISARVLPASLNARLALANSSIDGARARVAARIADRVADPDAAALLTALAVGLTSGMSADQWRVFNATGTTHLVAISGSHVTMFALLAFFVARLLWRLLPSACVEREPFALLAGLGAAGGYALLAGLSVPTQRTWLMLATFALAKLGARHLGVARGWALALIAVLLLDPFAPLAAGFWLSFAAVGVILLLETTSLVRPVRRFALLRLQFAVMLALAPLTFAVFDGVSIAGLWVNLLAIPIISFVLVPLVLAGAVAALTMPAASAFFFGAGAQVYRWLWPGLVWAADADLARWQMTPPLWWLAFAAIGSLFVLRRWPLPLRITGWLTMLPLLCAPTRMPEPGNACITVFDAGRGTSILIATHSHVLLFDTGDGWNTGGAPVKQLAVPALDALGRRRVDLLILPGLNADRAAGAALLADERALARIVVGGGWPATSLPTESCRDLRFRWDGVTFETWAGGPRLRYCLLRVSVGAHGLLLAGDLDAAAEHTLLARLPAGRIASDAVIMGRQASSLASSAEWIEASAPGLAVATGGIVPSESRERALERWRESGARVLDTRRDGALTLEIGTSGVAVVRSARTSRYPFHWRRAQSNGGRRAPV